MDSYKSLFIILLLGITFTACTERIDVQLGSSYTKLVVEGELSTLPKAYRIKLSKSSDYFSNKAADPVSDATVTISDGSNTIQLKESADEKGSYFTPNDYAGKVGNTYHLVISNVDINNDGKAESYEATSKIPPVSLLTGVAINYNQTYDFYKIFMFGYDPGNTEDYYGFRVWVNNKLVSDTITEITTTDDRFFNGNKIEGLWVQNLYPGKKDEAIQSGSIVTLEVMGITKECYNFIRDVSHVTNGSNPLFGSTP
ncbi:MAG: DUF4249 family protein, partial [Bacteroidota bacterium]|nr:DUF4249 family protein [Bacteroidota bacterium]